MNRDRLILNDKQWYRTERRRVITYVRLLFSEQLYEYLILIYFAVMPVFGEGLLITILRSYGALIKLRVVDSVTLPTTLNFNSFGASRCAGNFFCLRLT